MSSWIDILPTLSSSSSSSSVKEITDLAFTEWPEDDSRYLVEDNPSRHIQSWDFDLWKFEKEEYVHISASLLKLFSYHTQFQVQANKWCRLVQKVQQLMSGNQNPYHNYRHVIDVTQTCATFLGSMGGSIFFTPLEGFTLLVSALLHDLDHPGTNNLYQINAGTELAIMYNDQAVLENHHCATSFRLFQQEDTNIFDGLSVADRKLARKLMIGMILATDMSVHFAIFAEFDELEKRHFGPTHPQPTAETLNEKDRLLLLRVLLHTADISNPAKVWPISRKWSDLVLEEFFNQGDREKAEGLPVSPSCDRLTTFQDELSLNFCDFIVAPFFVALVLALPTASLCLKELRVNRSHWNKLAMERFAQTITDPVALEEAQAKWVGREKSFHEKVDSCFQTVSRRSSVSSVRYSS